MTLSLFQKTLTISLLKATTSKVTVWGSWKPVENFWIWGFWSSMHPAVYCNKVFYSTISFVRADRKPVNVTPSSLPCELVESLIKS